MSFRKDEHLAKTITMGINPLSLLELLPSLSPSLGFRHLLTNCETTDVLTLLSLLGDFRFMPDRGIFPFGLPVLPNVFLANLSPIAWLIPPLLMPLSSTQCGS